MRVACWVLVACSTPPPATVANVASTGSASVDFAVKGDTSVAIVRLDRAGLRVRHEIHATIDKLGWLDRHTLVAFTRMGPHDRPVMATFVDGAPAASVELDEVWEHGDPFVVGSREVWLERCAKEKEHTAGECAQEMTLRVLPGPLQPGTEVPQGADWGRMVWVEPGYDVPRTPETVPGPADVTLEKIQLDERHERAQCTRSGESVVFPDYDGGMPVIVESVRWVVTLPPIYEVSYSEDNGNDDMIPAHKYFRPCQGKPLAGFVAFGGGLWGEWSADGTWTFYDGARELGRLPGGAIRIAP